MGCDVVIDGGIDEAKPLAKVVSGAPTKLLMPTGECIEPGGLGDADVAVCGECGSCCCCCCLLLGDEVVVHVGGIFATAEGRGLTRPAADSCG